MSSYKAWRVGVRAKDTGFEISRERLSCESGRVGSFSRMCESRAQTGERIYDWRVTEIVQFAAFNVCGNARAARPFLSETRPEQDVTCARSAQGETSIISPTAIYQSNVCLAAKVPPIFGNGQNERTKFPRTARLGQLVVGKFRCRRGRQKICGELPPGAHGYSADCRGGSGHGGGGRSPERRRRERVGGWLDGK